MYSRLSQRELKNYVANLANFDFGNNICKISESFLDELSLETILDIHKEKQSFYFILDYINPGPLLIPFFNNENNKIKSNYFTNIQKFFNDNGKSFHVFFIDELADREVTYSVNNLRYNFSDGRDMIYLTKNIINSEFSNISTNPCDNSFVLRFKNKEPIKKFIFNNDLEYPKLGEVRFAECVKEDNNIKMLGVMTLKHSDSRHKRKDWTIINYTDILGYSEYKTPSFRILIDKFINEYSPKTITIRIPKRYHNKGFQDYIKNDNHINFEFSHVTNPIAQEVFIRNNEDFDRRRSCYSARLNTLYIKKYQSNCSEEGYKIREYTNKYPYNYREPRYSKTKFFDLGYDTYVSKLR